MTARILLADDNPLMREELRRLVLQHADWEICGEAVDGCDAINKANELHPDLIVLDLAMPRLNGLEAARVIHKQLCRIPMLMFTLYASRQLAEEARRAGVHGIVSKTEMTQLICGIEALLRHETFFAELDLAPRRPEITFGTTGRPTDPTKE